MAIKNFRTIEGNKGILYIFESDNVLDVISAVPDDWEIVNGALIYSGDNVIPQSTLTYKTERDFEEQERVEKEKGQFWNIMTLKRDIDIPRTNDNFFLNGYVEKIQIDGVFNVSNRSYPIRYKEGEDGFLAIKNKIIPNAIKTGYNLFNLEIKVPDSEEGTILGLTYEKKDYRWREAKGGEFLLFVNKNYFLNSKERIQEILDSLEAHRFCP